MNDPGTLVYLLHGNDEFAIHEYLTEKQNEWVEPNLAAVNITRLDGRALELQAFSSAAYSVPFLGNCRLVIVEHPTSSPRLSSPEAQARFISILENLPPTTRIFLVEYRSISPKKKTERPNWLWKWVSSAKDIARVQTFEPPKWNDFPRWVQERAKKHGGQLSGLAASLLADRCGGDPRVADQEIQKLLAFVGYQRRVEKEDIELLSADLKTGDIFALVDAVGGQNTNKAMGILERLLETEEPISILGMITRQYRLLIQAREILDQGGHKQNLIEEMEILPFLADRIEVQVRRYSSTVLRQIYHELLDVDEALKTSRMPVNLLLETLVVRLGGSIPIDANPEMIR